MKKHISKHKYFWPVVILCSFVISGLTLFVPTPSGLVDFSHDNIDMVEPRAVQYGLPFVAREKVTPYQHGPNFNPAKDCGPLTDSIECYLAAIPPPAKPTTLAMTGLVFNIFCWLIIGLVIGLIIKSLAKKKAN